MNHESQRGKLPCGGWNWYWEGDPDRGFGIKQPGGWIYNILPFIDQQTVHDMGAGQAYPAKCASLTTAAQIPLAVLYCPTRRPIALYPNGSAPYCAANMQSCASSSHTDYACNGGTAAGGGFNPWSAPNPGTPNGNPSFFDSLSPQPTPPAYDGVIQSLAMTSMGSITDGASNTYLVGEKYLNPDHYLDGTEGTDNNCVFGGEDWDYHRWANGTAAAPTGPLQDTSGLSNYLDFGACHPSGFNMAFCDGSVHSISYFIDPLTHLHLACRNDGVQVNASKY